MNKIVHNIIILDESGSMAQVYDAALTGTNEVLNGIGLAAKQHSQLQQQIQLVTFDSNGIKQRIPSQPWQDGLQLKQEDYQPCAMTPLYDAIGITLTSAENSLQNELDSNLVATIITDGYENASNEYDQHAINTLITRLRAKGWQIIFMGANVDVERVAMELNIKHQVRFSASNASISRAFSKLAETKQSFYACMSDSDFNKMAPHQKDQLFKSAKVDERDDIEKARDKKSKAGDPPA
jgi:Mg-chelatase subunit ChlD